MGLFKVRPGNGSKSPDPVSREDLGSSGFSENKGLGQGVLSLAGP